MAFARIAARTFGAGAVLLAGAALSAPASAEPVALVEDLSAERDDLQLMDYLEAGRTIQLEGEERLVLGYLFSCMQEEIRGGRVIVGENESAVEGGAVDRRYIDCDGGGVVLREGQDQEAGAGAFRTGESGELPVPDRVLYGLSPLIKFSGPPQTVKVERLDAAAPIVEIAASGPIIDTAEQNLILPPGALYRFSTEARTVIVKISSLAERDAPPTARLAPM